MPDSPSGLIDTAFLDSPGGAADESAASDTSSSESDSTDLPAESAGDNASSQGQPDSSTTIAEGLEADAEGAESDLSSDTGEPTDEEEPGSDVLDEEAEAEISDQDLEDYAKDPSAPEFARKQIENAMGRVRDLKGQISAQQQKLAELQGQQVYSKREFDRARQAEESLFQLSSIAARPDDIDSFLKETNPRVYNEYKQHVAWQALAAQDGSPNLDTLQTLIDRYTEYDANNPNGTRVQAKDVVAAMEAFKNGKLDRQDFETFNSEEERDAFERTRRIEKANEERQAKLDAAIRDNEFNARNTALQREVMNLGTDIQGEVMKLMDKFHLTDKPGDPAEASQFKQAVRERLASTIMRLESTNRHFKEVTAVHNLLSQPAGESLTPQEAAAEVAQYMNSQAYSRVKAAAMADLMREVEKVVIREAKIYNYMMKGMGADRGRGQDKRPLPRKGQGAKPENMSREEYDRLSAKERFEQSLEGMSNAIRSSQQGSKSFG